MTSNHRSWIAGLIVVLGATALVGDDKPKSKQLAEKKDQATLEKEFSEKLTGAAMIGTFTIAGRNDQRPPSPERYEIAQAAKLNDNLWLFSARIKYGDTDLTVPVPLSVYWASDTPVISLTNAKIPGLGTFTARVMVYGDRYAGTWQHGQAGGHMWGRIETPQKHKDDANE